MARPEILYPLFAEPTVLPGIGEKGAQALGKLGVDFVADLLFLAPSGVLDRRLREDLSRVERGDIVTLRIVTLEHRPGRTASSPYQILVEGGGTRFEIVYFHARRDWLEKTLPTSAVRVVSGKAEFFGNRLQITHPDLVLTEAAAQEMPPFEPVYPLSKGLNQKQMRRAVTGAIERIPDLPEWLRPDMLRDRNWPSFGEAIGTVHNPSSPSPAQNASPARDRLAYDELLSHQLALALVRARMRRASGQVSRGDGALRAKAAAAFGHPPTGAQQRAVDEILRDMEAPERMLRLLQGDVGSGKTWVALMALLTAVEAGGQGALMAPTEILARQHAEGLATLCAAAGVELVLLTGRDKGTARRDKLAAIESGQARIVIGTHALFQASVVFRDLRLAVIDEQHRFGVRQRMELTERAPNGCDVLIMTATPIPRTMALAGFGDLDLSILDEKPPGRQPVETRLVSAERYAEVVDRLEAAVKRGERAYWVCPLVSESEVTDMIAAEERFARLAERLGPRVALVHGQLGAEEKDAAMAAFQSGEAQVLVATTVIEVGVDVPEATIMVIEQAERFGLSQLHQLRGRVGRGSGRSSCLLMFQAPLGETARERLETMRATEDGFRIAEADFRLRGPGDVIGTAQAGLPQFRIADLATDQRLMEAARDDARLVEATDPDLTSERGKALKTLLHLMSRDRDVRLLSIA